MNNKNIGRKCGVLEIIDISHRNNKSIIFNALCSRCNSYTKVSNRHLTHNYKSCRYCVNNLQKEISNNKYLSLRKYKKIYNSYKGNAKHKNIEFTLTLENIKELIDNNCYYCKDEKSNGIDKVNPKEGYHMRNCVSCCRTCNFMKSNFNIYTFFEKIDAIYNNHLNK